jgi:ubiquinone/menaquinone biosynthesis C-methylase UbiE
VALAWDPPDDRVKREFWFINPSSGGFRARFAIDGSDANRSDAVQLRVIDPITPLDNLRDYYIPSSIKDYQNLPSAKRQKRVMGWSNGARFVFLGRTHYETIRNLARRYGFPTERMKRILDFGVGCGRIARHFLAHDPHVELHGVDVDADNIKWCTKHLRGGHFQVGPLAPPLPYVDHSFDLVHANSVFTHLTEEMQDLWLTEIARILKPNGLTVITFHGETAAAWARMPLKWLDQWVEKGIDSTGLNRDLAGFIEDEEYYRNTYHTTAYIRAHWSRYAEILAFHRQLFGYQDAVIMRAHPSIR